MKAPVGLLSDRTVCDSRWRGLAPTSSQMYIRLHCLLPAEGEPTISMTALLELLKNADPEVKAQLRLALLT